MIMMTLTMRRITTLATKVGRFSHMMSEAVWVMPFCSVMLLATGCLQGSALLC